LLTAIIM